MEPVFSQRLPSSITLEDISEQRIYEENLNEVSMLDPFKQGLMNLEIMRTFNFNQTMLETESRTEHKDTLLSNTKYIQRASLDISSDHKNEFMNLIDMSS